MKRIFAYYSWLSLFLLFSTQAIAADVLPSWNNGDIKTSIVSFVSNSVNPKSPHFVKQEDRIAVFDNDGTLWSEQPLYFQVIFAMDRVKAMAPQHPEWKKREPFRSAISGETEMVFSQGEKAVAELIAASHAGITTDEFNKTVKNWLVSARHPRFQAPYASLVYPPMVELIRYLQESGYKTYIASGGGVEFMRAWAEEAYGIPPEQVIGSTGKTKFEIRNGKPVLVKLAEIDFVDDKEGKPSAINKFIGRRPVMAFGNSDGDLQMLQWTMGGDGPHFAALVHHTDAKREYAYDRASHIGTLDKAWDEALAHGWSVIDMKQDWKTVFNKGE